ncbi:MAG: PEF-CTERM sorting domain-containing protein [Methanosarcinales archaeon]|nr:PEF-CTERM sorting domain-containing protein [Methanosarcinales archaeon]
MNTRKTIRISMIALLVVALSVSMAAADPDPDIQACKQDGTFATEFLDGEDVYARGAGTGGDYVDIYIMKNRDGWTKDSTKLITSYAEYVTVANNAQIDSDGYGFAGSTNPAHLIWAGTDTAHGTYDIILDVDQNGYYDGNDDVQDGLGIGFTVVPEFATIAIPVVALLGLVFFMRRKKD